MIRLLMVDDHRLFRLGMAELLKQVPSFSVVGQAENGEQALSLCRELRPDVVLMDVLMPGMGGLEATQRITRVAAPPKVLALTGCADSPFPTQMLKAGALGYMTKDVEFNELVLAIKRVFLGKRYVCNAVAQQLAAEAFDSHGQSPFASLSHREMQIMLMVVNCQKVSDISVNLHLSPKTVNSYRYRIFDKLNVSSDVELVLMAVKYGMIQSAVRAPLAAGKAVSEEENARYQRGGITPQAKAS